MIKNWLGNLMVAAVVTLVVALIQSSVELVTIGYLYSDMILGPSGWAMRHLYDAFAQLYQYLQPMWQLPVRLNSFTGQGFFTKLLIGPDLFAMSLVLVVPIAAVLGTLATVIRVHRRRPLAARFVPMLACLTIAQLAFHAVAWVSGTHMPLEMTVGNVTRNLLRDLVHGGTLVAGAVTVAGATVSYAALRAFGAGGRRLPTAALAALAVIALAAPMATRADLRDGSPPGRAAIAPGYNVVLISIDSLRADHVSAYGYDRNTSPTMAALAGSGVRFANTSSTTSWTLPSHMSILTGRSLLGHGVISDDRKLTDDVPTLAGSLRQAGYTTGAIVSAPYLEARYGFDKGFDEYDDQTISFATHGESYKAVTAPLLQQTAAAWLERHAAQRFFLFLHYWDVHYDYSPSPPYDTMFDPGYTGSITGENFYFNPKVNRKMAKADLDHIVALYDGEIRLVDDHLAMLRATLANLEIDDKTIIVVTSDHGDEFFEHGRKGHHRTLYEEVLHVPLIVYIPGVKATRKVVTMETSTIDIMPTILSILGVRSPRGVEGVDLSSVAFRGDPEWNRSTFGELYRNNSLNVQTSLQNSRRKFIQHFYRRDVEAYNLGEDPGEHHSLPAGSGFASALSNEMAGWLNGEWPIFDGRIRHHGVNALAMDAETRERLRSLGYIQ